MLKLLILTHQWTVRLIAGSSIALFFIAAAAILTLRYWVLPDIERYRSDIERTASQAIGERVSIDNIRADWTGIHPHLILHHVRIFDSSGKAALTLSRVENSLSWMTLFTGEIRFSSLEFDQPRLGIRRDKSGTIYVAGIPVNKGPANAGVSDWLLHQSRVVIKNGSILWEDEARDAPPLILNSVNFALINSRQHHLFGLQAILPADLSSPIDVRGNLFGNSLNDLRTWRGKLYARIDYADTARLGKWLPSPDQLIAGAGAMRVWVDFSDEMPDAVTSDVALSGVKVKLGKTLPEIGMKTLRGRIGWTSFQGGFELITKGLSLETDNGESVSPTNFLLRSISPGKDTAEQGEISANSLDLGVISRLSEHFPIKPSLRKSLLDLSPKGKLHDLQVTWKGDEPESGLFSWLHRPGNAPRGMLPPHYGIKCRFDNLGLSLSGNMFTGISGHLDGNESGGSFSLDARHPGFFLPRYFESALDLNTLTSQGKWQNDSTGLRFSFDNLSFANDDLAGNLFGSYSDSGHFADFTGRLTRIDAARVWRYLPLVVSQDARNWVKTGILKGESDDAKIRIKGNLDDFPFDKRKGGLFQTLLKVRNADILYAPGWPRIESAAADILFQGARMEIASSHGKILGTTITSTQAIIADLDKPVLEVSGEAAGPTDEFLKFIDQSPVTRFINGFTEGMHATGPGSLKIKLNVPLEKAIDTTVSGSYQFGGDGITGPGIPDISHVAGRLDFSESGMSARNVGAVILGGAAVVNASTLKDGTLKVSVSGKINPQNISSPLARHFHGNTDWHGMISVRKKKTDILIESGLQGLASDLPEPFAKGAAEAVPIRFQSKPVDGNGELMTLSYGKVLAARFSGTGFMHIDHGTINLGETLAKELPESPGIWLVGSLKSFDADRWRDILDEGGKGGAAIALAGVDLDIDSLTFLGKNFGKLAVSAKENNGNWQASVSGEDADGDIQWIPEGKGRVVARFRELTIPFAPQEKGSVESKTVLKKVANRDLPALDITADSFVLKNKPAGRLELVAVQQGNDWKIQKLRISNPDSILTADGLWEGWAIHPRTNIHLDLEVIKIGKFLARFGYPSNIMRGRGKMEGTLSWAGSPQSINYASLNGSIALTAKHGQFNKIDPGIGKLLGILSLQALPRRITLDFRDIFSQGFAFDDISSSLKISDGIASTNDLRIVGPAAEIGMSGSIDLDRETQDLKIVVKPQIGDSFSVASSLLGGPVLGIATWVVGKVLQDPLDQLASYEYNVTGSWTDPVVKKVDARK